MFASEQAGIRPDLLCLAKGLTGGYLPMAATLTTEAIYQAFLGGPEEGRTFYHGHTYTGNALAAAAALATIELLTADELLPSVRDKIARLTEELARLRPLQAVGDIRQFGLAAGIELVRDRASRAPFPPSQRVGMQVCRAARRRGVFLRPLGDTIVLMPPLSVTGIELVTLVDAIVAGIEEVTG
jgi:adenosylmethionine-8-amino-7-oxononanoate aminotransferase